MQRLMYKLIATLISMLACFPIFAQDVELSWEKGLAFLPDSFFPKSPSAISIDTKFPVVIYLHGCNGINYAHDVSWAREIAKQNFIVVLPDSMVRPNRRPNCDPQSKKVTNSFPQAHDYRQEEITYAVEQIEKRGWVDKGNIFLMGFSEGGVATARSMHGEFKGLIVLGWTCTTKGQFGGGIFATKDVPVLAIASIDDEWFKGTTLQGRCIDAAVGHKVIQVDIPGREHTTFHSMQARAAVIKFLRENIQ